MKTQALRSISLDSLTKALRIASGQHMKFQEFELQKNELTDTEQVQVAEFLLEEFPDPQSQESIICAVPNPAKGILRAKWDRKKQITQRLQALKNITKSLRLSFNPNFAPTGTYTPAKDRIEQALQNNSGSGFTPLQIYSLFNGPSDVVNKSFTTKGKFLVDVASDVVECIEAYHSEDKGNLVTTDHVRKHVSLESTFVKKMVHRKGTEDLFEIERQVLSPFIQRVKELTGISSQAENPRPIRGNSRREDLAVLAAEAAED